MFKSIQEITDALKSIESSSADRLVNDVDAFSDNSDFSLVDRAEAQRLKNKILYGLPDAIAGYGQTDEEVLGDFYAIKYD